MTPRLDQRVAIVTGGASGLGKAIAQRLASESARVCITDIQSDLGKECAAEAGFTFLHHDVSDETHWARVIRQVEERFGRLDILVNSAGIAGPADAANPENSQLADWRKIFAVNVEGVFLGCRSVIPAMKRTGGGSIVNVSSIAGLLPSPAATAYGASKAAVRQLTKSVAQHCAELKIRCNSVHPGTVRTPLFDRHVEGLALARRVSFETVLAEFQARIPVGAFALPEDIAAAVAFLASEESRHITGTKLIIDGGRVSCSTYQRAGRRDEGTVL
jgi:3(or 17)beta-hydroxysteroid dehydrogenase